MIGDTSEGRRPDMGEKKWTQDKLETAEGFGGYFWDLAGDRLKSRPPGQGTIGNVIRYRKPSVSVSLP